MSKVRIVVVDDDEIDRYLVKRVIQSSNLDAELLEFPAGDDFLEVAQDDQRRSTQLGETPPPILLLLDINLPRMSGIEVLKQLHDLLGDDESVFCVVMYSSSDHPEDRAVVSEYSFVKDFVVKPLDVQRLQELAGLLDV